jgi:hypothetical protein
MLSCPVYFSSYSEQIRRRRYPHKCSVNCLRIGPAKNVTKLGWFLPFHIYCRICVQFGVRNLHKILSKICELRGNQNREGNAAADVSSFLIVQMQLHAASRSATCVLAYSYRADFVWSFEDLHSKLSINNKHFSYGCLKIISIYDGSSSYFQRSQFLIKIIPLSIPANLQINLHDRPF